MNRNCNQYVFLALDITKVECAKAERQIALVADEATFIARGLPGPLKCSPVPTPRS